MGKLRLPQGRDLSCESGQRPRTTGTPGPDPARFPATVPPFPIRAVSREWVVGVRLAHPAGPRGWSHTSPAPSPLAEAPGAGRGRQMLGRRRQQELGRGRSRGARRRARAPLAGPPSPLRTALAGVRRGTGRPGGGCGTDMHSARLDSFLGHLRWELLCGRDTGSPPMPGPLPPPPKHRPGVRLKHQLRASDALEEDSVCGVEEEDDEVGVTADRSEALGGPREHGLDWDSGFSEVSGSTWREEELPVPQHPAPSAWPLRRQRLSTSGVTQPGGAPVARVPPVHRPRPKSTPDACLEHWRGLEAEDWPTALLSRGRSRQPLVLGDNCFADLVHNWMELPEAAGEGDNGGGPRARARPPQFLLGLSEQLRRQLARARRAALAGKRLSCPPRPEPELPADVSRFAALMSCRSRQPIICNDVVSYL